MKRDIKVELKVLTRGGIISKSILFWSIGGFIFGIVELWVGIALYPLVLQNPEKFIFGPFVYALIGIVGGGISGGLSFLFYGAGERCPSVDQESFCMAGNISFILCIWLMIWIQDVLSIADLKPIVNFIFKAGFIFIFYILGCIIYQFLKRRKISPMIFFIALSFSLYTFFAVEMYLNSVLLRGFLIQKSIIYNLLTFFGSIGLGLGVYYISLKLARVKLIYRAGIVTTLILFITATMGIAAISESTNKDKISTSTRAYMINKDEVLNSKKPNILLITLDALRADHLSSYGYSGIKTRSIDSLAANGVLFEHTIAPSPWTLSSFFSMHTALYPTAHGAWKMINKKLHGKSFSMPYENIMWLAEILKDVGYSTNAFITNHFLSSQFGFGKGFDVFLNVSEAVVEKGEKAAAERRGFLWRNLFLYKTLDAGDVYEHTKIITQKTINLLEAGAEEPFFLWVHYFDPHLPYERLKTYGLNADYKGRLKDKRFVREIDLKDVRNGNYNFNDADKEYFRSIYDEEILFVDEHIGLILKKLEERNMAENTMIILSSDHGEEFWEHGGYEHGHTLYREVVHIPLILKYPGIFPPGTKVSNLVSSIDIMPTILDVLNIKHRLNIQGRSLLPIIQGKEVEGRMAFSEDMMYFEKRKSVRTEKYSFIYFPDSQKKELYDLENDPHELKNINGENPDISSKLLASILNWQKDSRKLSQTLGKKQQSKTDSVNEETKKKLKALGYL